MLCEKGEPVHIPAQVLVRSFWEQHGTSIVSKWLGNRVLEAQVQPPPSEHLRTAQSRPLVLRRVRTVGPVLVETNTQITKSDHLSTRILLGGFIYRHRRRYRYTRSWTGRRRAAIRRAEVVLPREVAERNAVCPCLASTRTIQCAAVICPDSTFALGRSSGNTFGSSS